MLVWVKASEAVVLLLSYLNRVIILAEAYLVLTISTYLEMAMFLIKTVLD